MTDKKNLSELVPANTLTRRRVIAGGGIALGGLAVVRAGATGPIIPARAIHQKEDFKAPPERVYEALLDAKQFSAFSAGRTAEIHREAGGAFSLFDGHILGRNVELVPNQRIIQAWRAASWPECAYSIAWSELNRQGAGTRVVLDHTGFPSELAEHLESGWHENY